MSNANVRVLIIEDDRALEAVLSRVLKSISPEIQCDWVGSAEDALVKIKQGIASKSKKYDLILADIFLEGKITGIDFWQTCQVLCPSTTVLVMSSMPVDCFFETIGSKAVSPPYLAKPFSVGECKSIIEGLLHYGGKKASSM